MALRRGYYFYQNPRDYNEVPDEYYKRLAGEHDDRRSRTLQEPPRNRNNQYNFFPKRDLPKPHQVIPVLRIQPRDVSTPNKDNERTNVHRSRKPSKDLYAKGKELFQTKPKLPPIDESLLSTNSDPSDIPKRDAATEITESFENLTSKPKLDRNANETTVEQNGELVTKATSKSSAKLAPIPESHDVTDTPVYSTDLVPHSLSGDNSAGDASSSWSPSAVNQNRASHQDSYKKKNRRLWIVVFIVLGLLVIGLASSSAAIYFAYIAINRGMDVIPTTSRMTTLGSDPSTHVNYVFTFTLNTTDTKMYRNDSISFLLMEESICAEASNIILLTSLKNAYGGCELLYTRNNFTAALAILSFSQANPDALSGSTAPEVYILQTFRNRLKQEAIGLLTDLISVTHRGAVHSSTTVNTSLKSNTPESLTTTTVHYSTVGNISTTASSLVNITSTVSQNTTSNTTIP